jgi:CRISPR-associated endonuclease/helicase Cas3
MVEQVRTRYFESSRLGIVRENPGEAVECFNILQPLYPQGVYLYHSGQRAEERMRIYSQLRELEKEGEGYLLIADGAAVEAADLDVNMMITSTCSPEQLIRRAGRCNRRADLVSGEMIVVGTQYVGRELPESRAGAYLDKLKSFTSASSFNVDDWKMFIV